MKKHAAVTIVSKNYFAFATTLADSYLRYHPNHEFIIILVDKADGYVPETLNCGAEVIELGAIAIPDIGRFIYRYSIMELNTAVKPFALAYLFNQRKYETLLYIDPDILVFHPLSHIYEAFEHASILLTPHIQRPFYDNCMPSDLAILQSGTYNLGFIGLKNSDSTTQLLNWWMTKLYRDCVVDIPNGLFVDQKWMDLVPGFFPDHKIIYDTGYNVAYWNLHERSLSRNGDGWFVESNPLVFFHFSGYLPFVPSVLSKHQDRHNLEHLPVLRELTDSYANLLMMNGYEESCTWPYAFGKLSNGVQMPLSLVREIMQWASRTSIQTPCPIEQPDEFCQFLMSRCVIPGRPQDIVLFHFLLKLRPDVRSAFPGAECNHDDRGFRLWIQSSALDEYQIGQLLRFEDPTHIDNYVLDAFERLRSSNRDDIFLKYQSMWMDNKVFSDFADWFTLHGIKQLRFTREHTTALKRARPSIGRILNIYFLRADLQTAYPSLWEPHLVADFSRWLLINRCECELVPEGISLFQEFANASRCLIEKMRFLYAHKGIPGSIAPNIFDVDKRRQEINSALSTAEVVKFLDECTSIDCLDHFYSHADGNADLCIDLRKLCVTGLEPRRNYKLIEHIRQHERSEASAVRRVNMCGYLNAQTGMGEAARSMKSTLAATETNVRQISLPHPLAKYEQIPNTPALFGWPFARADVSISVANADSTQSLKAFLPKSYWSAKNIGYWVWETEALPHRYAESAKEFDEIWAPSLYAATAIAKTVDRPVRVVPHVLDFSAIVLAQKSRRKFHLPEDGVLFGFIFDPRSGIERKNVAGLVRAFRHAFKDDDNCFLVLKVNGSTQGAYEYEMVRANADWDHILFVEAELTRKDTFDFMKSLDVYVSLHRSEGFGLTCAEAMALGVPVMASNYSGNLEFMTAENSLLVPTRVIETARPYGAYPAGTCWGDPDHLAAVSAMRSLTAQDLRIHLGQMGERSVRQTLDPTRIGNSAKSMVDDLLATVR